MALYSGRSLSQVHYTDHEEFPFQVHPRNSPCHITWRIKVQFYIDAKGLTEHAAGGYRRLFLAADVITGFWIAVPVENLTTRSVLARPFSWGKMYRWRSKPRLPEAPKPALFGADLTKAWGMSRQPLTTGSRERAIPRMLDQPLAHGFQTRSLPRACLQAISQIYCAICLMQVLGAYSVPGSQRRQAQ